MVPKQGTLPSSLWFYQIMNTFCLYQYNSITTATDEPHGVRSWHSRHPVDLKHNLGRPCRLLAHIRYLFGKYPERLHILVGPHHTCSWTVQDFRPALQRKIVDGSTYSGERVRVYILSHYPLPSDAEKPALLATSMESFPLGHRQGGRTLLRLWAIEGLVFNSLIPWHCCGTQKCVEFISFVTLNFVIQSQLQCINIFHFRGLVE